VSRGTYYSSTFSRTSALDGGWGQPHAPAASTLGKTRYPLYRRLRGPQGRSGQVRKISPPTGIRSPDRPAQSQSLYRLSYPDPPLPLSTSACLDAVGLRSHCKLCQCLKCLLCFEMQKMWETVTRIYEPPPRAAFIYLFLEVPQSGHEEITHSATLEGKFCLRLGSIWFDSWRGYQATYVVVFACRPKYAEATFLLCLLKATAHINQPKNSATNYALSVSVQLLRTVPRALCCYRIWRDG